MAKPKNLKKTEEVENAVASLFAHRGYHATSMRDIARELGMNQSSLYYYFKSKEGILFKLMNDAMDAALQTLEAICVSKLSAEDKLNKILGFHTWYYAGEQEREILLLNEMNSLGEDSRQILIRKQKRYVKLIKTILEELGEEHKMKEIHPTVAAFAFFGMVHYTVKWYHKDGPIGLEELAKLFVEIFTRGILK